MSSADAGTAAGKGPTSSNRPSKPARGKGKPPRQSGKGSTVYFYYVCAGNGSRLVISAFRSRPWWRALATDRPPSSGGDNGDKAPPELLPVSEMGRLNVYWSPYRRKGLHRKLNSSRAVRQALNHFEFNTKLCFKKGLYRTITLHAARAEGPAPAVLPWTCVVATSSREGPEWDRLRNAMACCSAWRDEERGEEGAGAAAPALEPGTLLPGLGDLRSEGVASGLWIVKPAERTKQGQGIAVVQSMEEMEAAMNRIRGCGAWVVQKYLERPLLFKGRKFDMRVFVLKATHPRTGALQAWVYRQGYLRTASKRFRAGNGGTANARDRLAHLTNDAVQRRGASFGRFEGSNKVTYPQFAAYLRAQGLGEALDQTILPRIRRCVAFCAAAAAPLLDRYGRRWSFELFGYDFMVDEDLHVWLLEVNANPSFSYDPIEQPFKDVLIPTMLEGAFCLTVDRFFPPPRGRERPQPASREEDAPHPPASRTHSAGAAPRVRRREPVPAADAKPVRPRGLVRRTRSLREASQQFAAPAAEKEGSGGGCDAASARSEPAPSPPAADAAAAAPGTDTEEEGATASDRGEHASASSLEAPSPPSTGDLGLTATGAGLAVGPAVSAARARRAVPAPTPEAEAAAAAARRRSARRAAAAAAALRPRATAAAGAPATGAVAPDVPAAGRRAPSQAPKHARRAGKAEAVGLGPMGWELVFDAAAPPLPDTASEGGGSESEGTETEMEAVAESEASHS